LLKLHYTRVAGSGENFTFTEGDVPVEITRASDRGWTARASWPLGPLALEPGDMLIYRGVATDRRPGAPPAESNALIVEIAAPGALPSEGFAIDDRQDKYAISQQMVIVNTERLLACVDGAGRLSARSRGHRRRTAAGARRVRLHDGRRAGGLRARYDDAQ
jgi:hypothetical protein